MQELFNLQHASAQNVVEQILGVLKRRFHILLIAPEYSMDIQAQIPVALCAIHNFINAHDPNKDALEEISNFFDDGVGSTDDGRNFTVVGEEGQSEASIKCDQIAQAMWVQYQKVLVDRALSDDGSKSDDEFDTEV